MSSFKAKLMSTTVATAFVGVGIMVGGVAAPSAPGHAAAGVSGSSSLLPTAKPKPRLLQLAACNPCAVKKAACGACNPCAVKKKAICAAKKAACGACNPCVAKKAACGACNPCAAKKAACGACNPCAVKKLAACGACNPCAAKKAACGACNPCAAKKAACGACNPCAAKKACNPCNPCAAKAACGACNPCNPCNPCGGASTQAVSAKCVVPRLTAAWKSSPCNPCSPCYAKKKACNPCNPCAAKKVCGACNPCAAKKACGACNPCAAKKAACGACNPCAAKKAACGACNPCAAKKACNPCNPCAAKNPCNPCGACNPCGPCGAESAEAPELSIAESGALYNCMKGEMRAAYSKAGVATVRGYQKWVTVSTAPYASDTHGNRYTSNAVNSHGDYRYKKFEEAGTLPLGTVLAKDSMVVRPDGKVAVGPLFIMEKKTAGWNKDSGDWQYSMVLPNGKLAGATKTKGMSMTFCAECHGGVAPDMDYIMLLPEDYRKSF